VEADKLSVPPLHTGVLLDAIGGAGAGVIVTDVVPAALVQPLTVAVTEYVPLADSAAFDAVAFCEVDANPFGPLQL
jgi:hypothetical protein